MAVFLLITKIINMSRCSLPPLVYGFPTQCNKRQNHKSAVENNESREMKEIKASMGVFRITFAWIWNIQPLSPPLGNQTGLLHLHYSGREHYVQILRTIRE